MGNEASKTRELWGQDTIRFLSGRGIDIGAGKDLIVPGAVRFDKSDGDANKINDYIREQYDWVFSSHFLEHMNDPHDALPRWRDRVKPGGHLILIVPDEELYEQGYWPSLFNEDHKWTFTTSEHSSCAVSINIYQLIQKLPNANLVSVEIQDKGYKRDLIPRKKYTRPLCYAFLKTISRINKLLKSFKLRVPNSLYKWLHLPIDQTGRDALAQIQVILQKTATK